MELVLVERRFEQPTQFTDIQGLEDAGISCLETHHVRFLKSFLSKDRRRMLCLYEAPDAESVRLAEEQAKVPYERAWSCQPLGDFQPSAASTSGEYVVAERSFPAPITRDFILSNFCGARWCLDLHRATYIESFLGMDGMRMVCIFRAPDAESVRMANNEGGIPYTTIWTASLHES